MNNPEKSRETQKEILKHFIFITGKDFKMFENLECSISEREELADTLCEAALYIMDWMPVIQNGVEALIKDHINTGCEKTVGNIVKTLNEITLFFGHILKYKEAINMLSDESMTLREMVKHLGKTALRDNELDEFVAEAGKEVSP